MTANWPKVRLREVLIPVTRAESVLAMSRYGMLGAHWYARGLYTKNVLLGSEIQAPKVFRVEAGDFVYNRLFAWKGSFALATNENDGCYVSNEFPCFSVVAERLLGKYLWLYFSREAAWDEALGLSTGGTPTSRNRLKEERFLELEIPLPPLNEQRRIVARIEELSAKIKEARGLRLAISEESNALKAKVLSAVFDTLMNQHPARRFNDVCQVVRGGSPRPAGSSAYYDGPIPFLKVADLTNDNNKYVTTYTSTIKRAGLSHTRLVEPLTLMLTNSGATLGVPKICMFETTFNDGIQAFLGLPNNISKEYLYYFFASRTRWFRDTAARGQGQPNLNTDMVKTMSFPCPPLPEQRRVVEYLDGLQAKVDTLKKHQEETSKELDAIMPSILSKAFAGEL
ncbi:MAG: restriction endonuclease subunit S [Bryobacteraceae bacterium]|nr:restriction endonuclease subunit S [Solibacteraceae bacterium]MCO5350093.1 restriction endonuclease subunit S [Bryobacteraceae bacterium]